PAAALSPARAGISEKRLPVTFEVNQGQADAKIKFISRTSDHSVLITSDGAIFRPRKAVSGSQSPGDPPAWNNARVSQNPTPPAATTGAAVRMRLVSAARKPRVEGLEPASGKMNYFLGNNPAKWRTGIPTYGKVKETNIYPGIDLVYRGDRAGQGHLEYDFVVGAGADPGAIALSFDGASGIRIDGGDLLLSTSAGELRHNAPTAYQEIGGIRTEIASKYEIKGKGKRVVSFRLGTYDHRAPLVIDPTVVYSTYFGGNGYSPVGLAVDASGNAYITGNADTATF